MMTGRHNGHGSAAREPRRASRVRRARFPPAPEWRGELTRTARGVSGTLVDPHGWHLNLTGFMQTAGSPPIPLDPPRMWVRADVATPGAGADPLRAHLTEFGFLAGDLERTAVDAWEGAVWFLGLRLELAGTMVAPGRIEMRGRG